MIILTEVLAIHEAVIAEFGGSSGVRESELLKSALNRPYTTFDQMELYPEVEEKASAFLESIVKNHPFVDGNKRTGYVLMRYLLLIYGKDIKANEEEKYDFVIKVAEGKYSIDEIQNWIKSVIYDI